MHLTAKHYDGLRDATELPDDPKPIAEDAIRARRRAIDSGRLKAPPRDEMPQPVIEHPADVPPPIASKGHITIRDEAPPMAEVPPSQSRPTGRRPH